MRTCKNCQTKIKDNTVRVCPKCHKPLLRDVSGTVGAIVGGIFTFALLLLVVFGILGNMNKGNSSDNTSGAPIVTSTPNGSPTPTTDPCAQYLGTSQMVDCMKMQTALDKGNATHYPLKAKVTYDNSALYITNLETTEWDMCTATVNDTNAQGDNFTSDGFAIKPGQTESIGWGNFANAQQVRFNVSQTKPNAIDLDCTVGGTTNPQSGAVSGGQEHRSTFNL